MKTSFEVTRLQRIARNSNIYARLAGQYSSDRMVSAEQWSLGGPNGVRAYPSGEGLSDSGYVLTAEWQQNISGGSWQNIFDVSQLYAFVDVGEGKLNNTKSDQGLRYDRSGVGIGFKVGRSHDFLVNMNYAWTLGDKEATTTNENGQFWLQAVKWFE
jgi:hemolysin activation/secretion protein